MRLFDYGDLIDFMDEQHRRPPALLADSYIASDAGNGLLARTGYAPADGLGVKLASVFPSNTDRPTVHTVYVLFDPGTGEPVAVIVGNALTWYKTACDSALASRRLARPDSSHLVLVGAGAMAPHLIRAHMAACATIDRVTVWNRSRSRAEALVEAMNQAGLGVAISVADDVATAVADADIVSCATMAGEPVVHGSWLRDGTHLDLVGSYLPDTREVDDTAITRSRIFVDHRDTAFDTGELKIPIEAGLIGTDAVIADHYELAAGRVGREFDADITLFKNAGGGHLDLMAAQFLLART